MIVLVTGATAGYGEAIARRFLQSGARVVACGRRQHKLEALAGEFGNDTVCGVTVDVTRRNEVERALSSLPAQFAAVDVLVNNAGLALGTQRAQDIDLSGAGGEGGSRGDSASGGAGGASSRRSGANGSAGGSGAGLDGWETMVDTNIKGLLYCTSAVLPGMVKRNRGHIVNMGSVAGEFAYPGGNIYCSSKAFVHHFSLSLKADLLGTAVRVTNIEPGLSGGTEFSQVRFGGDKARAAAVYEGTQPLTAFDVAEAVWWACSLPAHVNINYISMMPVCQAPGPLIIDRSGSVGK